MRILTTSTGLQTIKFIPREDLSSVTVRLIGKNTKTTKSYNVTVSNSNGYMTVEGSFDLEEGFRYSLAILSDTDDIIYRDVLLCTDQSDLENYNIQDGDYVFAETNDNEYVIIE
jgi:hypothetical protein